MPSTKKKNEEKIIRLTDMTVVELVAKIGELTGKIQKQRLEIAVGRAKNIREVFHLRKQLARTKTVISLKNAVKSPSNQK